MSWTKGACDRTCHRRAHAVVWLPTCAPSGATPIPKDAIAAHELLHSLGALPAGAPNACPGDPGHPCDSPTDVLYPYATGAPLTSLVLDYNHDDYYGHSGTWIDIQDSQWLHLLAAPQVPLEVSLVGGPGRVRSDVPGVDCTEACTTQWDGGARVSLSATPSSGYRFVGWSGGCTGAATCTVTLSASAAVTAVFGPARVALRRTVTGKGRIACSPACGPTTTAGGRLLLRAVPAKGWAFTGWGGACKGRAPVCQPSTAAAVSVRARFAPVRSKPRKKRR